MCSPISILTKTGEDAVVNFSSSNEFRKVRKRMMEEVGAVVVDSALSSLTTSEFAVTFAVCWIICNHMHIPFREGGSRSVNIVANEISISYSVYQTVLFNQILSL